MYLPVELDRAGTELSLTSGSWDHTRNMYHPTRTPQEIAQGRGVSKVMDFRPYSCAGDMRCVLYPAAVSLVLRLVRILSVAGKHVLLSGYPGSTRVTALHLAAKICNLEPVTFDVKDAPGIVEASPSATAAYSTDFLLFLKSAVYRATGLAHGSHTGVDGLDGQGTAVTGNTGSSGGGSGGVSGAGSSGNNGSSGTSGSNSASDAFDIPVSYISTEPQRLLVIIRSCQQLGHPDRRTLLNLIDGENPGSLFNDNEILGELQIITMYLAPFSFPLYCLSKIHECICLTLHHWVLSTPFATTKTLRTDTM